MPCTGKSIAWHVLVISNNRTILVYIVYIFLVLHNAVKHNTKLITRYRIIVMIKPKSIFILLHSRVYYCTFLPVFTHSVVTNYVVAVCSNTVPAVVRSNVELTAVKVFVSTVQWLPYSTRLFLVVTRTRTTLTPTTTSTTVEKKTYCGVVLSEHFA